MYHSIEKLQARIKELEEFAQEGWDLAETYSIKIGDDRIQNYVKELQNIIADQKLEIERLKIEINLFKKASAIATLKFEQLRQDSKNKERVDKI